MTNMLRQALGASLMALTIAASPAHAGTVALTESGSTLLYPVFQSWANAYLNVAPNVAITMAATGSGAGTDAALNGTVVIGTSDAYLSDEKAAQNPDILDIPLAISAQTIAYNLPGLGGVHICLDGPTLAGIYSGKITQWDDPAIKAMNPGVALPSQAIVPVRRSDASGDTFIFSQFLDFSTQTWEDNPGYGSEISWPDVAAEKTAVHNDGMLQTLAATPYSVGYVGISYAAQIAKAGLGIAMIENQAGKFLLPTPQTIADAAAQLDPRTPPYERISLIFAPGDDSYPLINYEYAVVSKSQTDATTSYALRNFLRWVISDAGGNNPRYLVPAGFIPLPDFIRGLSEAQIDEIGVRAVN